MSIINSDEVLGKNIEVYSSTQLSQMKRGNNREQSAILLEQAGIVFTSNNYGAHLIVEGTDCFIDFWPGTGRWKTRRGTVGFGVKNLIKLINN